MTRLVLPAIVAFLIPSGGFADAEDTASPRAVVAGEVENPGRFELTQADTLGAIFSRITTPLAMGSTQRIRIHRNGRIRTYDLKKLGNVPLADGDIVEVPAKYIIEDPPKDLATPVFCADAAALMKQVALLKSDLWKTCTNWRDGLEGTEFRPTGKLGIDGGVSVFVRAATPAELAALKDPHGPPAPKSSEAILFISRSRIRGSIPYEYETTLNARIRAISSPPVPPSEPAKPSAGDKSPQ
jgi:hypothetical protein